MPTGIQEGQGFSVVFGTTTLTINYLDVSIDGVSVTDINTSDQSTTGGETYIASTLKEGGNITYTVNANMTDQIALFGAIGGDPETITIIWPKTLATAGTLPYSGYISKVSTPTVSKNNLITQQITTKVTGTVTPTNESA